MPLQIPDEYLAETRLTEQEAQVEIACRLFSSGHLDKAQAMFWAGVSRTEFEEACLDRGIPLFSPTIDDFQEDLESLRKLGL